MLALLRNQLGQAEIQNLGLPAHGDEDVGWLDIAVHDAFGMSSGQGIGDLNAQVQQLFHLQRLAADALAEGLALQQLHDQVRAPLVLSDVVNRADVGVIQSRGRAGFPMEALRGLAIGGKLIG